MDTTATGRIINWYDGTEDDRHLVRMWLALSLPVQWRHQKTDVCWTDWEPEEEDKLSLARGVYRPSDGTEETICFMQGIEMRLKP